MKLYLKPIDTFTFRDHRDFQAGEDNMGYTFSFPTPSTIYGALRSAYIYHHSNFTDFADGKDEAVKEWMGTPTSYGKFKVLGTFIEHEGETYFPVPFDMQVIKEKNDKQYAAPLMLVKENAKTSDGKPYRLFAQHDGKSGSGANWFIAKNDLIRILKGNDEKIALKNMADFIVAEDKIGIAVDAEAKTTEKGKLYQLMMFTFKNQKNTSFVTYLGDAPNFDDVPFARVGRKGRPWRIEPADETLELFKEEELAELKATIKQSGVAKIVFLTPAILDGGTEPFMNGERNIRLCDGLELEVLTLATGRPDVIGGYDIVKNRPKPRKNALPAGTVLYVKVPEEKVDAFVATGRLNVLTHDRKQEGFGLYTIGTAKMIHEEEL